MKCCKVCRAFTLIEMLISIVLLSLIIATMMFGFKQSISHLQQSRSIAPQKAIEFEQLRTLIKGMFPYVVEVQEGFEDKKLQTYLQAQENSLEFVSQSPIYHDEIVIAKLQCLEEALVYYEKPLYGGNYLAPTLEAKDKKKIFFESLEACQFSYQWGGVGNNPTLVTLSFKSSHKAPVEYRFMPMVDFNNTRLISIVNDRDF